jgi:Collagen triple helix repeat (20 copies)
MFTAIRKQLHITPSTVIALMALVFALTGGAFAATGAGSHTKLLATTSKAKPAPKGKAGPRGATGAKGATGAAGPAGAMGPAGASGTAGAKGEPGVDGKEGPTGKEGKEGVEGKEGTEGVEGKEGSPWTAGGTLPAGKTETGTFSLSSETGTGAYVKFAAGNISFTIPLSAPLAKDHVIYVSQSAPSECENSAHPGSASVENPEASAGYLCVYQGAGLAVNKTEMEIFKPSSFSNGADVSGALLLQEVTEAEALSAGTWAVTAP